jgi:hypothetical protein
MRFNFPLLLATTLFAQEPKQDADGDPLPPGAVARQGRATTPSDCAG